MEIQSDLIILSPNNFLPLPWSVRGPLGLETGAEVSIALVHSKGEPGGLPDIIVTPLQSEYLNQTYTLEIELGERAGAVADFLGWLGTQIATDTKNAVNIVLSETITVEGRNKHTMHIVLEPASENSTISKQKIRAVMKQLKSAHKKDIINYSLSEVYKTNKLTFMLQQDARVENGWIKYGDWKSKILEKFPDAETEYDLGKVVVSSNPNQRLLRFIIPKKGVIEIRVPHRNRPGALREISRVIGGQKFNILSSRLSRTPPPGRAGSTSVFVAACEPLEMKGSDDAAIKKLISKIISIDNKYNINTVKVSRGRPAEKALFLTPRLREMVTIDEDVANLRTAVRNEIENEYHQNYGKYPAKFVFLSFRFINEKTHKSAFDEQAKSIKAIVRGIEMAGCAVIQAANPAADRNKFFDQQVYKAVFSRLWASDACAVLALNEESRGHLSNSISHEIGFFSGRNRPLKVFVSGKRDIDPVFGNIVGMNRITYPDGDAAFDDSENASLFNKVKNWAQSVCEER